MSINLSNNRLDDDSCVIISNLFVNNNGALKVVNLAKNRIEDEGLSTLLQAL